MNTPERPVELAHLYDHSDWLRGLARAMVADSASAEDLVQETWLAALRNPPDPARPARPWLAGVMRNLLRLRARTDARRLRRHQRAARKESVAPSSEGVERIDLAEKLVALVTELEEPYRTTLVLHYFHEFSAAEIARRQNVSAGTVRWRIWRGLGDLRARLERSDPDRKSWMPALIAMVADEKPVTSSAASTLLAGALSWKILGVASMLALACTLLWFAPWAEGPVGLALVERTESARALVPLAPDLAATSARAPIVPATPVAVSVAEQLFVREYDGSPAADWPVLVATGAGEHVSARTDAQGALPTAILKPGAHLFLGRPHAPTLHIELPAQTLPSELQLERGALVEGRITVGGRPPSAPLELVLTTDRPLHEALAAELGLEPSTLWSSLSKGRKTRTRTDAEGAFRFHGLADDWSGLVVLPPELPFARECSGASDALTEFHLGPGLRAPALHFDAPSSGLRIELESQALVRGRIVEADGTTPVPGARLRASFDPPRAGERASTRRSNDEGRFELGLDSERPDLLRLEYWDEEGRRGGRRELRLPKTPGDVELGPLKLASERGVAFVVRDAAGRPIEGASASAEGLQRPSAPTDAAGEGVLVGLGLDARELIVRATGYHPASALLPEFTASEADGWPELELTLRRTSRLGLALIDEHGAAVGGLPLRVSAREPLFLAGFDSDQQAALPPRTPSRRGESGGGGAPEYSVERMIGDEGRVELEGLRPGVGFALEVRDRTGRRVLARDLPALAQDEWRAETLRVPVPLRTLAGVVEIEGGGPLVGAVVRVIDDEGGTSHLRAEHDGSFRIPGLSADELRVEVSKPGFRRFVIPAHRLEAATPPLRVVLNRAGDD